MAKKAFLQIKDAEAQAQDLIKNAQNEAARIIKRAEEETAYAFLQNTETRRQQILEKERQTEASTKESVDAFSRETARQCDALKQKLLSQKPKAVEAVIRFITEKEV